MEHLSRPRKILKPVLVQVLLVIAIGLAYWPVFNCGFNNYDDDQYITGNPHVLSGLTWDNTAWAFASDYASNWHPLTWLSHMLDVQLFGLNPGGHHLTNLLFHLANTLLLFLVLRRLTGGALWRSAFVAALFALHPLHVESVAWVAERKDVLSGFFFFLTLWAYAEYVSRVESRVMGEQSPKAEGRDPKEGRNPKSERAQTAEYAEGNQDRPPAFRVFRVFRGSKFHVHRSKLDVQPAAPSPPATHHVSRFTHHASRWYALALVLFALGLMSKPMLVTLPFLLLLLDYWPLQRFQPATCNLQPATRKFQPLAFSLQPLLLEKLPFFALSAISSILTISAQRSGESLVSLEQMRFASRLAHALVAYSAYLEKLFWPRNLVVLYFRREPFPAWKISLSACVLAAVTWWVIRLCRRRPWLLVGWLWYLGMLVPVIGLVQVGSQFMADRYTYLPLIGCFIVLAWGAWDLACRFRLPRSALIAIAAAGLAASALAARHQVGYWRSSEVLFKHCLAATTPNYIAENSLGWALAEQGRLAEAEPHFRASLQLKTNYFHALNNLGMLLALQGKPDAALPFVQAVIRQRPENFDHYLRLGPACDSRGESEKAIGFYKLATRLAPDRADLFNNLAWILATHPEAKLRDGTEAARLARQACELTGYHDAIFVGTLGAAYAEAGRFEEAGRTAETAIRLALESGQQELADKNRALLDLFQSRQPYHEPPVQPRAAPPPPPE